MADVVAVVVLCTMYLVGSTSVICCAKDDRAPTMPAECPICLDVDAGLPSCRLPCGHLFHAECVHRWIAVQPTCPACRAVLV